MTKRQKAAFIFNILIFIFTVFASVSAITGFEFMGTVSVLSSPNLSVFKYFTMDSNVFAGLISLLYIILVILENKGRIKEMPAILPLLKLAATTSVTLTMMVTVFFLAPQTETTYFAYFTNANLFMHLVTPLLCIISFIFFEKAKISFPQTFWGLLPMFLYSLYYIPNILLHLENGKTSHSYDWYGFLDGGLSTITFVIPIILIINWLFSLALWALNKKINSERK